MPCLLKSPRAGTRPCPLGPTVPGEHRRALQHLQESTVGGRGSHDLSFISTQEPKLTITLFFFLKID